MNHVLLFGNGLNRLTQGNPSWDDLLKDISSVDYDMNIPNTFKYEIIIASQPYKEKGKLLATKDGRLIRTSDGFHIRTKDEVIEERLKNDIAKRVQTFGTNKLYEAISKIKFSHYLTTNYDNVLLNTVGNFSEENTYKTENVFNIHRKYNYSRGRWNIGYWPIHGTSLKPASITLGLDQYCGSIAKMKQYINGGYSVHEYEQLEPIEERLRKDIEIDKVISWIDLFFISNVHILGLGLGYEETDLWWLLNKRKRLQQQFMNENLICNHIYYYSSDPITKDKQQLFEGFGVEIVKPDIFNDFESRYHQLVGKMKEKVNSMWKD